MSDIQLNDDGDIELAGNDFVLTTDIDAIKQHLSQRMKTFLGEWFHDNRIGIPYFEHILKKNIDPVIVDTVLKRQVITTPGIIELLSFNTDLNNSTREMTVTLKARTNDGVINFSEVIP